VFLKTLTLRQFRNHTETEVSLDSGFNFFVGPNGSGKSNLLEAVSVLTTGQSHRGAEVQHLIQKGRDGFSIRGVLGGEEDVVVDIQQKRGRPRRILVNNVPQKTVKEGIARIPLVSFSPEDLGLVKGDPSLRRRLLNEILCQTDPAYRDTLYHYTQVVTERNGALRLIREGKANRTSLDPWDLALLQKGIALTQARQKFLALFSETVSREYHAFSLGWDHIRFTYRPSFLLPSLGPLAQGSSTQGADDIFAINRQRLLGLREGELALGVTLAGPHRDEVDIFLGENLLKVYGSQGQQRTVAMAVKMAECRYLGETLSRKPLYLLDDVLSELDGDRRLALSTQLPLGENQCIVTLTDLSHWPTVPHSNEFHLFQVKDGSVFTSAEAHL
jgi:DNA replication and repair protein RecF